MRGWGGRAGGLGLAFVVLACGSGEPSRPRPPPAPERDYAIEAAAWCRGQPALSDMCGVVRGERPPDGVYVGLIFDTRKAADLSTEEGSELSVLTVGPDAVTVGGIIAGSGLWGAFEEAERAVRACFLAPCPDGPELPAEAYDRLMKGSRYGARPFVSPGGHLHARSSGGHGYPQLFDVVRSSQGPGYWIGAEGTPPAAVRRVSVHLATPARRGPSPAVADLAAAAAAWCRSAPTLAPVCGTLGVGVPTTGRFVGLRLRADGQADPLGASELAQLRMRSDGAALLSWVSRSDRAGYEEAVASLRGCLLEGCTGGPALPADLDEWQETPNLRTLYPEGTVGPHLHANQRDRSTLVEHHDLVRVAGGVLLATGTAPDTLDHVWLFVPAP